MKIPYLLLGMACSLFAVVNPGFAQGTAFTYQGRLNDGTQPAIGLYDLTFTLFDTNSSGSPVAGPITNSTTVVSNGLFNLTLDFGNHFDGTTRWLEIGVRTNGAAGFITLSPRQPLTPAPYAIFANTASNLSGTLPTAQLSGTFPASQLSGTVNAGTLNGQPASYYLNLANQTGSLSPSQLPPGIINSTGVLAADYEFDETSGTTFADSSGFGNNATAPGGGIVAGVAGHSARSVAFSGGYLKVPGGIPDSPQVWVEAWVNPQPPTTGAHMILSKTGAWSLQLTNGSAVFSVSAANGNTNAVTSAPIGTGTWSHVAGWYDGLNAVVEVNGTATVTSFAGGPVVSTVADPLYIGAADDAGTHAFSGSLDEVRIRTVAPPTTGQRRVFYITGNNLTDGWRTSAGTITSRTLTFTKASASSRLRITYVDNFAVQTAGSATTWEVRLDGASLSPTPLSTSLYDGGSTGTVLFQPGTLVGYVQGAAAGAHTLTVYVSAAPGYSSFSAYTGWNSTFLLEVEEIQ